MIYKRAYAKINLGLQVIKKRDDGFHDLRSIMLMIDLYDELYFEKNDNLVLQCDKAVCNNNDNLVYKTAKLLIDKYSLQYGSKIKLYKKIRPKAGLAGGSSDAASTIKALNDLWDLNLKDEEMRKIGTKIGSDVLYCLYEKPAIVEGRGDIITKFIEIPKMFIVLVFPDFTCSTKNIFSKHKIIPNDQRFEHLIEAINSKQINIIGKALFNDLEVTVDNIIGDHPIANIKKALLEFGCLGAVMTGSGSSVFGIVKNQYDAEKIKQNMIKKFPNYQIITTKTSKI